MTGRIEKGDAVFVRGHWWIVVGRHHSFGKLVVEHLDPMVQGVKVFAVEDVESHEANS